MAYVRPQDVRSPRASVGSVMVLHDGGPWKGSMDHWSLAVIDYDDEPRLAIRWNGFDKEKEDRPPDFLIKGATRLGFGCPKNSKAGSLKPRSCQKRSSESRRRFSPSAKLFESVSGMRDAARGRVWEVAQTAADERWAKEIKAMTKDLTRYAESTGVKHWVDGIGVQFCYPRAWKANLYVGGKIVDVVPVVTIRNAEWKTAVVTRLLGVRFRNRAEAVEASKAKEPFYVAVAWNAAPADSDTAVADGFFAVFLVQSTGKVDVDFKEIDAKILGKRVSAVDLASFEDA